jgi:aspartokinase
MVLSFNPQIRDNYIILTQNKINNVNDGAKILIRTKVTNPNTRNNTHSLLSGLSNYTNIIILNYNSKAINDSTSVSNCFLTLNNIKNNIKFIFTDNNKFGKILFIKNTDISNNYIQEKNYLVENITIIILIFRLIVLLILILIIIN